MVGRLVSMAAVICIRVSCIVVMLLLVVYVVLPLLCVCVVCNTTCWLIHGISIPPHMLNVGSDIREGGTVCVVFRSYRVHLFGY